MEKIKSLFMGTIKYLRRNQHNTKYQLSCWSHTPAERCIARFFLFTRFARGKCSHISTKKQTRIKNPPIFIINRTPANRTRIVQKVQDIENNYYIVSRVLSPGLNIVTKKKPSKRPIDWIVRVFQYTYSYLKRYIYK